MAAYRPGTQRRLIRAALANARRAARHVESAELSYSAQFPAPDTTLRVSRHDGGNLDWYHALAHPLHPHDTGPGPGHTRAAALPQCPRRGGGRSIGGQAPDRAALATLSELALKMLGDSMIGFQRPQKRTVTVTY